MATIILDADYTLYEPQTGEAYARLFAFLEAETGVAQAELQEEWEGIVAQRQLSREPDDRRREVALTDLLDAVDADARDGLVDEALDRFWETIADTLVVDEGVPDAVQELAADHAVVLATDEFRRGLEAKINVLFDAPEDIFAAIITPDDVGQMKPSARYVRVALEETNTAPADAVAVGDSWERDLKAADALGSTTVRVGAGGGYPDYVIASVADLPELVEEHDGS